MAQFDYKKFLKEGGVEKYLMEADFGNDPESRYEYIRPLMSKLPDSARTETLIDGMEDGLREDDKELFDYYFVEAMKALGLEQELMEPDDITPPGPEDMPGAKVPPFITDKEFQSRANVFALEEADSLTNPEAEEIDDDDLAAAADYFDSLAENDDILDEIIAEGDIQVGDIVYLKADTGMKSPMKVVKMRRMFGSNVNAAVVTPMGGGKTAEYDETQLVRAKRGVDLGDGTFEISEMEGEVQSEEVTTKIGAVQKGNVLDAIKLLNHIQYEMADEFTDESMESLSDVIVMLGQVLKTFKK